MGVQPEVTAIPVWKGRELDGVPPPSLRSLVRKSALLNLGILLSGLPLAAAYGGPDAILPTLVLLAAVSLIVWVATFAGFSLVSLWRIFRCQGTGVPRRPSRPTGGSEGLSDDWLDGPV
jgi:hypothetical protein